MKLNQTKKDAFVRAVMDDVPNVDYYSKARKLMLEDARKKLPPAVRKIYDDPKTRGYIETKCFHYGRKFSVCVPTMDQYSPDGIKDKLDEIVKLNNEQDDKRHNLNARLRGIVQFCNTRKQLVEALPEFEKYLPPENVKTRNLPVVANVVSDFMQAGWPKGAERKSKKQAA